MRVSELVDIPLTPMRLPNLTLAISLDLSKVSGYIVDFDAALCVLWDLDHDRLSKI